MRARYRGQSFGADGLTDGRVYDVVDVEWNFETNSAWLRVIDDSGEDYLYSSRQPGPLFDAPAPRGRWELVEDDADGTLAAAIR